MGPVGAVALIEIFGIFFYIKVLKFLTIVASTENPKKKLQLKDMNPIPIPIRDYPHGSKILALSLFKCITCYTRFSRKLKLKIKIT